jgi:thymidylate kinase
MRTIILEGIATSGKSTVIKMLVSSFPNSQIVKVVPEAETLMAIESNTDLETSISYLKYVIEQAYQSPSDVVIFDRLYLTHMFRVHGAIADFAIIEDLLIPHQPTTVFLEVDESTIAKRVELASQHRDLDWRTYIQTKVKRSLTLHSITSGSRDIRKNFWLIQKSHIDI